MRLTSLLLTSVAVALSTIQMPVRPVGAQVLAVGDAVGRVGDVVAVEISLHPVRAQVSAIVGDIQFDSTVVSIKRCAINPAIGPGTTRNKEVSIAVTASTLTRFVVFGLGQSTIPHGVVFTCEFTVLPNTPRASASGEHSTAPDGRTSNRSRDSKVILHAVSAADPQGNGVTVRLKPGEIRIHRGVPHGR